MINIPEIRSQNNLFGLSVKNSLFDLCRIVVESYMDNPIWVIHTLGLENVKAFHAIYLNYKYNAS